MYVTLVIRWIQKQQIDWLDVAYINSNTSKEYYTIFTITTLVTLDASDQMFYASNDNTTIMICVEKYYIPLPKIKLKKKKTKTTSHSYKTSKAVGSFNYWRFSSLFFLSFLAKHDFRWISKQMKHSLVNGLPWCSRSSTLIIFPLLFFGKLFNQFTLLWGQIPAQIILQIKNLIYYENDKENL